MDATPEPQAGRPHFFAVRSGIGDAAASNRELLDLLTAGLAHDTPPSSPASRLSPPPAEAPLAGLGRARFRDHSAERSDHE